MYTDGSPNAMLLIGLSLSMRVSHVIPVRETWMNPTEKRCKVTMKKKRHLNINEDESEDIEKLMIRVNDDNVPRRSTNTEM
jgi:hypothetical protein